MTPLDTQFQELDQFEDRVPREFLEQWLRDTALPFDQLQEFVRFHPEHYLRNLVHGGPAYHVLLLCWRNGQRSPIHDHIGSGCGVKVLQGTATETVFDRAPNGMIFATRSRFLTADTVCATEDADIHQISNLQAEGDLVTLHVYSPPLMRMNVYSLDDRRVKMIDDPINAEFTSGAGI